MPLFLNIKNPVSFLIHTSNSKSTNLMIKYQYLAKAYDFWGRKEKFYLMLI